MQLVQRDSSDDDFSMPENSGGMVYSPPDSARRMRSMSKPRRSRSSSRPSPRPGAVTKDFRVIGFIAAGFAFIWLYLHYGLRANVAEFTGSVASPVVSLEKPDNFYTADTSEIRKLREDLRRANMHIDDLERAVSIKAVDPHLVEDRETAVLKALRAATPKPPPPPTPRFQNLPNEPLTYSLDRIISRAVDNTVVLSFCSIKYLDPMVNWLSLLQKHGIKNWGLVCLDLALRQWLHEHNSECAYILKGWKHGVWDPEEPGGQCYNTEAPEHLGPMPLRKCKTSCEMDIECAAINYVAGNHSCAKCSGDFATRNATGFEYHVKRTTTTLWFARWKLLVRLLDSGINVMLADLDAIFLKNPLPFLRQLPPADLIAQRGSFPQWLSAKWGAALCMGFVYWRSTPATRRFTVAMNQVLLKTGDDQIGVNVALDKVNIRWDEGMTQFTESRNVSLGTTERGLRVAMLPHNMFPRICDDLPLDKDVLVAHCFESKKSGEAKKQKAMQLGLWVLVDNWEALPALPRFDDYLASVRT
eukprot:TRINITY_DN3722_c0_g1_i2.p1 TRINITY_DN3722_c0_g1~~TRINITY_DN3722_c0_g1_i2.p1  ORF type:complete len:539 (+),score=165.26 TRINITY_DN3722_c0_g1_i2:32-1618(+)